MNGLRYAVIFGVNHFFMVYADWQGCFIDAELEWYSVETVAAKTRINQD